MPKPEPTAVDRAVGRFLRQWIFAVLAALLLLVALVWSGANAADHSRRLAAQQSKIQELTNTLTVKQAENATAQHDNQLAASGFEASRKTSDDNVVESLLRTACTWNSYATYTAARDDVMQRFGVAPDSQFMTKFMPDVPVSVDSTGLKVNSIDQQGLNMAFDSVTTTVTQVRTDGYVYFALANVHSTSKDGQGTGAGAVALTYRIDVDGKVKDLTATRSASAPDSAPKK